MTPIYKYRQKVKVNSNHIPRLVKNGKIVTAQPMGQVVAPPPVKSDDLVYVIFEEPGAYNQVVPYNQDELEAFNQPGDFRPKVWLRYSKAKQLAA